MDVEKMLQIAEMVMKIVAKANEIANIYDRAKAGEQISNEELRNGQAKVDAAVAAWDQAAGP